MCPVCPPQNGGFLSQRGDSEEFTLRGVYEYMVGLTRQSLRFTLVIYVVVPLVIVSVIAGYVALRTLESAIEVRMQEDIELVGGAVRLPLSRDIEHDSAGGVERTLRSVFSIHRTEFVTRAC